MIKSTFIAAISFGIICLTACEQNQTPPEKVTDAFKLKFQEAGKVKWDMESETEWEAEFEIDGKEHSAIFNLDGQCTETEYKIKESDIPNNIKMILDENFTNYKIEEVEKSETPNGIAYEFEIESKGQDLEVTIDANGNLSKEIEEDTEDTQD